MGLLCFPIKPLTTLPLQSQLCLLKVRHRRLPNIGKKKQNLHQSSVQEVEAKSGLAVAPCRGTLQSPGAHAVMNSCIFYTVRFYLLSGLLCFRRDAARCRNKDECSRAFRLTALKLLPQRAEPVRDLLAAVTRGNGETVSIESPERCLCLHPRRKSAGLKVVTWCHPTQVRHKLGVVKNGPCSPPTHTHTQGNHGPGQAQNTRLLLRFGPHNSEGRCINWTRTAASHPSSFVGSHEAGYGLDKSSAPLRDNRDKRQPFTPPFTPSARLQTVGARAAPQGSPSSGDWNPEGCDATSKMPSYI